MSNRRKIDLRKLAAAIGGVKVPKSAPVPEMRPGPGFPLVPRSVIDDLLKPMTETGILGRTRTEELCSEIVSRANAEYRAGGAGLAEDREDPDGPAG